MSKTESSEPIVIVTDEERAIIGTASIPYETPSPISEALAAGKLWAEANRPGKQAAPPPEKE